MAESRLQVVGQETDDIFQVEPPEKPSSAAKITTDALALALGALSQRAMVAIASIFPLLMVASACWLWYLTPQPDTYQLVKLAMYGIFVLGVLWIMRSNRR